MDINSECSWVEDIVLHNHNLKVALFLSIRGKDIQIQYVKSYMYYQHDRKISGT